MTTETLDKMYLELSLLLPHCKTKRELELEAEIRALKAKVHDLELHHEGYECVTCDERHLNAVDCPHAMDKWDCHRCGTKNADTVWCIKCGAKRVKRALKHPRDIIPDLWVEAGALIYVENIRAAFNISTNGAKEYCEEAVMQGLLEEVVAHSCPNEECQRVLLAKHPGQPRPAYVNCDVCETNERDEHKWRTGELPRTLCFRAVKE